MRPQGVALPIVNLAVWLERQDETVAAARVAVGPGGPKPWRANAAEQLLAGSRRSQEARRRRPECAAGRGWISIEPSTSNSGVPAPPGQGLFTETVGAAWRQRGSER